MGTTFVDFGRTALFVLIGDPSSSGLLWNRYLKSLASNIRSRQLLAEQLARPDHVMIVIPKSDHWLGKFVFITERAQARRAQQKILASGCWIEPQPAGGYNPNKMSTGKQQYVSGDCTETLDDPFCPLTYLCWRFTARGAVAE
jgi:hypothetical protein